MLGHRFRARELIELTYDLFFKGGRMRGRRDSSFFEKINPSFVCFLDAAMQHCLEEWKEGEMVTIEFKFESASGKSKIGRTRTGC